MNGVPIIVRIIETLQSVPLEKIFVVVGSDESVASALAGKNVELVRNPDSSSDMLTSVRCGLRALPQNCDGVLIVLGDQPQIIAGLIRKMIQVFHQKKSELVVPVHAGRRGHPLLLARRFVPEILTDYDGIGLRGLLQAHPDAVAEVSVKSRSVLEDLDTPEDYQRQKSLAEELSER